MDKHYEVVLYGASGYTGKLTAWKLAERGIPFIAAGRNAERIEAELAKVPELKGHDYKCVAVEHDSKALAELFRGRKIVINQVGPFMQIGLPTVRACLEAGCHYFDTTGEPDWMLLLKREYGKKFADKGLILCPANAVMWVEGLLVAEIALETPGIDSLNIVYLADSVPSLTSTKSFLRMCTQPQYHLQNNALVQWPYAKSYQVVIPGEHEIFGALPWGGGGEPIWYEDDPRVRNCRLLLTFRNQTLMDGVMGMLRRFEDECRNLPPEKQEEVTNQWGDAMVGSEPQREDPNLHRGTISCHGRGVTSSVTVNVRGHSGYVQTGLLGAEAARRVLRNQFNAVGFASPTQVFGARALIGALAEEGLISWDLKSV